MSASCLGAYDSYPTPDWGAPAGGAPYRGWIAEAVQTTRDRLNPAEVVAAAAAARGKRLDDLIDDLIIRPAETTA
jgi:hypothetical protein